MEDFKTIQQKISLVNTEFLKLRRNNNDWVTCNQAGMYEKVQNSNNL